MQPDDFGSLAASLSLHNSLFSMEKSPNSIILESATKITQGSLLMVISA